MIENRISGERFETLVAEITKKDVPRLDKKFWLFDWKKEHKQTDRVVYKLTTVENPDVIQGLISLKDSGDHIFVHLVESALFNWGKEKLYVGVGGNLFAFACKQSFVKGYDGYISFESKTQLLGHYQQELGAARIGSSLKMFVDTIAAKRLVNYYFPDTL